MYKQDDYAIVSPAYKVFKVKDENELLSDFLMINFETNSIDMLGFVVIVV